MEHRYSSTYFRYSDSCIAYNSGLENGIIINLLKNEFLSSMGGSFDASSSKYEILEEDFPLFLYCSGLSGLPDGRRPFRAPCVRAVLRRVDRIMSVRGLTYADIVEIDVPDWVPIINKDKTLSRPLIQADVMRVMLEVDREFGIFLNKYYLEKTNGLL